MVAPRQDTAGQQLGPAGQQVGSSQPKPDLVERVGGNGCHGGCGGAMGGREGMMALEVAGGRETPMVGTTVVARWWSKWSRMKP